MYLLGFAAAWWLARVRAAKRGSTWKAVDVDDLIFYCMLGVILGGRIGYILFYGLKFWAADPWYPLKIWEGGMSFHGGLLGVVAAMTLFGWRRGRSAADVYDFTAPLPALGLFFGRIGNFINSELWGKVTTVPWGFRVDGQVRHPSQLYEASLEGLLLFAVMWGFTSRPRPRLAPSGLFLAFYGVARFLVEFVRVPDEHIGYLAGGWLTEGQLLSLPMILAGIALMAWAYRSRVPSGNFAIAH
jgi:phosphatidylglycerol:prolipoprotein diacylglycerol transferase